MNAGMSALVLEDSNPMRLLLTECLRAAGVVSVASVETLSEARRAVAHRSYDVALVDVGLDGENGLDFIRHVRLARRHRNRQMAMLVVSGQGDRSVVEAARDAGADGFLVKPVSSITISTTVKRLIAAPRNYIESADYYGPDRRRRVDPNYLGPERRQSGDQETFEID
jgi:DNA-binding response OmpR family regulator